MSLEKDLREAAENMKPGKIRASDEAFNVKKNRLANVDNCFQQIDQHKRVLCVCSAGLLRSPTAALVLSGEPFNFNTRAAGLMPEFALVPVDEVLLAWADEVVCMEEDQMFALREFTSKPIICLNIEDDFAYRDPELMQMIAKRY